MTWSITFFVNSILLGVGLAMDAFSVSVANGLNEPNMRKRRQCIIAGTYAFFQFIMPLIGWFCIHNLSNLFTEIKRFIPFIAFGLLLFIGGKMLICAIRGEKEDCSCKALSASVLIMQGIATSIDALSVGFTISEYPWFASLVCCLIIAVVTFIICMAGLILGKKMGNVFSGKASFLGGAILVLIGVEILLKGIGNF